MAEPNTNEEVITQQPETRASVIAAAVEAATKEDQKQEEPEKKEPEKKEPEKKEEPSKQPTEDELLAQQGKDLLLALKDPERAPLVIKFLAEQAGYTKSEIKAAAGDKRETAEIADDILDIIKSEMGDEFDVISERLARALKKILPAQIEKSQADIRAEMQEREKSQLQAQSVTAINKLTTEFFGEGEELPDNVSTAMNQYMDRNPPNGSISIKDYLDDAFHSAIGKLGLTKADKTKETKIAKNRSDVASRLASERVTASNNLKQDNTKPMTRQQAIAAAIETANKE